MLSRTMWTTKDKYTEAQQNVKSIRLAKYLLSLAS